jgi:hypothetical protein
MNAVVTDWLSRAVERGLRTAEAVRKQWNGIYASKLWPEGADRHLTFARASAAAYGKRDAEAWRKLAEVVHQCGVHVAPPGVHPQPICALHQSVALLSQNRWDEAAAVVDMSIGSSTAAATADLMFAQAVMLALVGRHREAIDLVDTLEADIAARRVSRADVGYYEIMLPVIASFTRGSWDEFNAAAIKSDEERSAHLTAALTASERGDIIKVREFDYLNYALAALQFSAQRRGARLVRTSFADLQWLQQTG